MNTTSESRTNIINRFADIVLKSSEAKKTAIINASSYNIFSDIHPSDVLILESPEDMPKDELFDVILGDFPIGLPAISIKLPSHEKNVRLPNNWVDILTVLPNLSEKGIGLFLVEPYGFSTYQGQKFTDLMERAGFFINAFFNTPENILQPLASLTPVIVAISNNNSDSIFIGELSTQEQSVLVPSNYFSTNNTGTIEYGKYIKRSTFKGFPQLKAIQQVERLETQYNQFEQYRIEQISLEVNIIRSGMSHIEKENSIYVPKIGNSQVVASLNKTTIKHHNYFQVVLNEKAINQYVASFFESTLGKLILQSIITSSVIPHINKKELEKIVVALPGIKEQREIVDTHNRLSILKKEIDKFDKEISINPTSSRQIQSQLDALLESIGSLSEADWLKGIARQDESKTIEFKETLSLDIKTKTKEKYIESSALKTIVAFLNSDGGILAIGVSDDGTIPGLQREFEKFYKNNVDNFLKHLKNLLKIRIGEQFYPYINQRIIEVDDKPVLVFECESSEDPCFLDGEEFFVRTNPATDKLEGPKLLAYVKHHFNNVHNKDNDPES